MMKRVRRSAIAFGFGIWSVLAGPAGACGFHGYLPPETAIDKMFSADRIVSARPSAEDPFRYAVTNTHRGPSGTAEIPHLIDSLTRRKLVANPGDSVLFARSAEDGTWQRLAYLDAGVGPVMDEVLGRLDDWITSGDEDRFQFFADLVNHPHPDIAALALAELDQAPYSILDTLRLNPDAAMLMRDFWRPGNYPNVPIKALLLGLSKDDAARAFLRRQFEAGGVPGGAPAGAFAVALIEIDGPDGIAPVIAAARHAARQDLPESTVLIEALAIHAETGEPDLQRAIRFQVGALLEGDPALARVLAPAVVRQFGIRADWSQKEVVARLLAEGVFTDPAARFDADQYLRAAAEIDPLSLD